MRVRAFNHAGLTVTDFDRAVRFYLDVLGCPLIASREADPERVRGFFGIDTPAARCTIGLLRVPGGALLEIFAFDPQAPAEPLVWNRPGITHLAFEVTDLAAWRARFETLGVPCDGPIVHAPGGPSFFYARDPDGNRLELIELSEAQSAALRGMA